MIKVSRVGREYLREKQAQEGLMPIFREMTNLGVVNVCQVFISFWKTKLVDIGLDYRGGISPQSLFSVQ